MFPIPHLSGGELSVSLQIRSRAMFCFFDTYTRGTDECVVSWDIHLVHICHEVVELTS
jgi:hypothetical protein